VRRLAQGAAACAIAALILAHPAGAEGQRVVVTVNDQPITTYDIDQRLKLWQALGDSKAGSDRKRALQSLIDDVVKKAEAKKKGAEPKDDMVMKQIERMAKGTGTDVAGLTATLKKKGVSFSALKAHVAAQIAFNRLLAGVYQVKVEVDQAEVDREFQKLVSDPRLKSVNVYTVMEISLPVEKTDEATQQQLLYARAVEAEQIKQKFKGCGSARKAAQGIFNVSVGKQIEADATKLPAELRKALDKAGPGRLIGPARDARGLQLIAFCGKRSISPQKPTREQVEALLKNKKYDEYEERYMREMRQNAYIDYKDPAYSQ
jgi:peptidyl-prolyl cis-trans isomerase SurA